MIFLSAVAIFGFIYTEFCFADSEVISDIPQFNAQYSASYNGFPVKAVKTLEQTSDNRFSEELDVSGFLVQMTESATFELAKNGQLTPIAHQVHRSVMGINRSESQSFDWEEGNAHYQRGERTKKAAISAGILDIPTHYLQLRRDLANNMNIFEYPVIARGKSKIYRYKIVGHETLDTPLGELETVKMQRLREHEKRVTNLWLAKNWYYLMVKLEQIENKKDYSMLITKAVINDREVKPPAAATEETL